MGLFDGFKTKGESTPHGNYTVEAQCSEGHTNYKKRGDSNIYQCWSCGRDVH